MRTWRVVLLLMAVAAMSACAPAPLPSSQVKKTSSFLGPAASKLKPGKTGQPAWIYLNPKANWASYDKMILDPVTFWRAPDDKQQNLTQHDRQMLVNYFYKIIAKAMSERLTMVSVPGPGVVRAQVAITKAEPSEVVLDVASSVLPQAVALSTLKDAVTGKPAFVGEARIAVKVTNAETGELLGAWVAARVGGKNLNEAQFSSWGDVQQAMKFWAYSAAYDLCKLQKRSDCGAPPTE
ncbi:MAG: DUF3313 domain-containing protein [Desulfarculaceae bacterium]|nr:DUF3313 domain-containing protein [Desulfarculaceae bacterium]